MNRFINIGYVLYETKEEASWTSLNLELPFCQNEKFLIYENKNRVNDDEPDFIIQRRYLKKNAPFRKFPIGALWKKKTTSEISFLSGYIYNPLSNNEDKKINIELFEPKVFEGEKAEDINWLYDVYWKTPKTDANTKKK